jgi:CheY-like chemotaxis protein
MNQQVIRDHLIKAGLRVVLAQNGKEGVDIVRKRMENGEKPFDLIFMDIHMPVMDGLEAASIITGFRTGTPLVAMTANIMSSDKGHYESCGLPDYLGKPFTSRELYRCLMKYITPVSWEAPANNRQAGHDEYIDDEMLKELNMIFLKTNKTRYSEIVKAIGNGDIITAHRLAHSLKSNAGLIGKTRLFNAAANAEQLLVNGGNMLTDDDLDLLKNELNVVLNEIAALCDEPESRTAALDTEQSLVVLQKLELMLEESDPECRYMLDDIRSIPGAELLAEQVDDLDFKPALRTLSELKTKWG